MNKSVLLTAVTAATFFQITSLTFAGVSVTTACPPEGGAAIGHISYTNPSTGDNYTICVNSAGFDLLGKRGTINTSNGYISYDGQSEYYDKIPGIGSYTPVGQATVIVQTNLSKQETPVSSGTIWYVNPVTKVPAEITIGVGGTFDLGSYGKGTIGKTSDGLFMVHINNQTAELRNIPGVSMYQLEGGSPVAVKYGTTGTIFGTNNTKIQVINGQFTFKGYKGQLEMNGDYVMENGVKGNVLTTDGVVGYQLAGGPYIPVVVGTTGTVTYKGKVYPVINGNFTLDSGVTGSLIAVNGVYDGSYRLSNSQTIYKLSTTEGVEGYQIAGKPYVSLAIAGAESLGSWMASHQAEVLKAKAINDPWGHNGGVNDAVLSAWFKANPKLSATQVLDDMATYKIDIRQLIAAKFYTDGSTMSFFGPGAAQWNSAMKWFSDSGISKQDLVNRGVLQIGGPADGIANGANLQQATVVGWVPLGVYFAYQFGLHPGVSRTSEVIYYSQKDLDVARGYEKNGYWGPDGTGDMITQLKKAGYIDSNNMWKEGVYGKYDRSESGPNIADPKMYSSSYAPTLSTVVTGSGAVNVVGTTAGTLPTTDSEAAPLGDSVCADFKTGFGYRAKDTLTNDNVTVLQDFLHTNGYLISTPTGFFGAGTVKAVKAFQKKYGISQTGYLGPNTRAKIKAIDCQ